MKFQHPILAILYFFFLGLNSAIAQSDQTTIIQQAEIQLKIDAEKQKLSEADLAHPFVTDAYTSRGISHVYFRQMYEGIEIESANAAVHLKDDQIVSSSFQFVRNISKKIQPTTVTISPEEAIISFTKTKKITYPNDVSIIEQSPNLNQKMLLSSAISRSPIPVRLQYILVSKSSIRLAWNMIIEDTNTPDIWNFNVDVQTGEILKEFNQTIYCDFGSEHSTETCSATHTHEHKSAENPSSEAPAIANTYNVFEYPVESPNFGNRSIVTNPAADNPIASPDGWHQVFSTSYTATRGNNVDAYVDTDDSNSPTGGNAARAVGGNSLDFNFNWTANGTQTIYQDAAVTNLFYWNNLTHDVWYNYGFDEPSGNFQENNFGRGGAQGDAVQAEAQDGGGTCNANFGTPPDGGNPRMQMYLCDNRDGDYDNGVIVHEYGHGISIRLAGGPSTSGCLSGSEQMGEGWSDWFGMIMTIEEGDQGTDSRGMGTWLFGQGPNGDGIRPFPYSTDLDINPMTYATIGSGVSVPHGVGSVWATMLWDMAWLLIDQYGFDPDIYNGTGGNNMAMALVIEGLKLQPCGAGFVDGRDAIIAADAVLYNGENQCLIWEAFARRGLGFSADQGSSASVSDGAEAFDMPPSCTIGLEKTANKEVTAPGGQITYTLTATNNTDLPLDNVIISDDIPENTEYISGGSYDGFSVSFPVGTLAAGQSYTDSFTVQVSTTIEVEQEIDFEDDMESGDANWSLGGTGEGGWNLQSEIANSGESAWFVPDVGSESVQYLISANLVTVSTGSNLTFKHYYNTESTWDGGIIEISTNGGSNWVNLGDNIIQNGYNSTVYNDPDRPAFSGNSGGFITTEVDLSAYADQSVYFRFTMICDQVISGEGWYIDDVLVGTSPVTIPNTAQVTGSDLTSYADLAIPTLVLPGEGEDIFMAVSAVAISVTCTDDADGVITAFPLYGTGNYSYNWSTGETTQSIENLTAGIYSVTVTDGETTLVREATVGNPTPIETEITTVEVLAGGDGSATISASGGVPPYTYTWSNGANTATIEDLDIGTYFVTLTDANKCDSGPHEVVITPCQQNVITLTLVLDNYPEETDWVITDVNGNVVVDSDGTYANYPDGTEVIQSFCLEPRCYTFTINDSYGDGICCGFGQGSYNIISEIDGLLLAAGGEFDSSESTIFCLDPIDLALQAEITQIINASCHDSNDGLISVSSTYGTGNYSYQWNNGASTSSISGLSAGEYSVTINDGESTITLTSTIEAPPALELSASVVNEDEDNLGSITADATGGTAPYNYEWSTNVPGQTIENLSAGTYELTVTDANDCTATLSVIVGDDSTCSENSFTLTLSLDEFPEQTTWTISDESGTTLASDGGYYSDITSGLTLTYPMCQPDGCYTFTINDSDGDGLCCRYIIDGSYTLVNDYTGEIITAGGVFDWSESTQFCFSNDPDAPIQYCGSLGESQNYEFIQSVSIGDMTNDSGNNTGYADFTSMFVNAEPGESVNFTLTPGFSTFSYLENWRIWIDYNNDGDFYEENELVFCGTSDAPMQSNFVVPQNVAIGNLRMRVSMKWGSMPEPCEAYSYGETEDYTLSTASSNFSSGANLRQQIVGSPELFTFTPREELKELNVIPNPANGNSIQINIRHPQASIAEILIRDTQGKPVLTKINTHVGREQLSLKVNIDQLTSGIYFVQMKTEAGTVTKKFVVVR